ncbi:sugar phosphate isomerase/epimerase [Rubripirellula amarantea]|uniref:Inosose isomerase n=1 Tax=Rubripirellula amarantea TaxID=2527999 RepID=A0A5C5WWG4_9BACT|nr:TIM barrel protein [Rubripirellula amarantea]MDA8744274.1 sugar phosphate isomerase/epimerase [Rubripirellula amarantea]TWT54202.1 Inosose isomerase [Rubripirellula amarantea]
MKNMLNRRTMIAASVATSIAMTRIASAENSQRRKFTLDLRCGSIGVQANQKEAIELAGKYGFESVTPDAISLAGMSVDQQEEVLDLMKEKNVVWGSAGLPVEFRKDQAKFEDDLAQLPERAAALQKLGGKRMGTYIMPCHDELTYVQNFRLHADRLRKCTKVLNDHGLRFGMEYVGPKTLWTSKRYSFLHSLAGLRDLIDEINVDNVGVILDSWHWYTAGESIDDIKSLSNQDVVGCDLNDAPKGIAVDQQLDNQRELPMATGVINVKSFLEGLIAIGYDGPVRAEPFNAALNSMDNDAATKATAEAMKSAFALI